jgi:hypothetical protein
MIFSYFSGEFSARGSSCDENFVRELGILLLLYSSCYQGSKDLGGFLNYLVHTVVYMGQKKILSLQRAAPLLGIYW